MQGAHNAANLKTIVAFLRNTIRPVTACHVALIHGVNAADTLEHQFEARAILGIDPDGDTCPAAATTEIIQIQPVFYSEFFPYNTVIDPFRINAPFTVSNAPTTVVLTSALASTIYSGGTEPPPPPDSTESPSQTTSSIASSGPAPTTNISSSQLLTVGPRIPFSLTAAVFSPNPQAPPETVVLSTPIDVPTMVNDSAGSSLPPGSAQTQGPVSSGGESPSPNVSAPSSSVS